MPSKPGHVQIPIKPIRPNPAKCAETTMKSSSSVSAASARHDLASINPSSGPEDRMLRPLQHVRLVSSNERQFLSAPCIELLFFIAVFTHVSHPSFPLSSLLLRRRHTGFLSDRYTLDLSASRWIHCSCVSRHSYLISDCFPFFF